jgi:hypothetical protein
VVHVAPSQMSREVKPKDGRVDATDFDRPYDPSFIIFYALGLRGIVVFSLDL